MQQRQIDSHLEHRSGKKYLTFHPNRGVFRNKYAGIHGVRAVESRKRNDNQFFIFVFNDKGPPLKSKDEKEDRN